jgi:3'-5' exoribonuclease
MQLIIQELARLADDDVELADYLPVATRSTDELVAELRARVDSLADPHLRGLLEAFLADAAFLQRYATAPAAKTMHHVYLGGLLEHSLAVADLADDVSRRYSGIQRDLLVVGALLHDIGKVAELCYERSFDYTDEGKLIGHIVMGVEMVEEKVRQLPDFPRSLATLVKHLLLSHHGQYEFGSPKRPKTLEAVILNFLDDLDSKINGVRTHIERDPDNGSGWTSYHRLYDRYFFKETLPSVAQRQEPSTAPMTETARPMSHEPKPEQKPEPRPERTMAEKERKRFGFTLADQLKGKSLDLFAADEQKKE